MIKGTKAIDLSKVDVEQLRKEIKFAKYKAIEINDLKEYIEQALEQMLNRNCTRTKFSERFKRIIDSYNAGGTENEDYYEQLVKLLEELRQEDNRANTEGLTEEELEIYDLLIAGKKLTQAEEQKVKLSAKNLYKKLVDNRSSLLVVDWYKDEQPRAKLKYEVELSLNDDLPESYDKAAFDSKVSLLMNHFADMAVQGYGSLKTYKDTFLRCMRSYQDASSIDLGLIDNAYGNLDFIISNHSIRKYAYNNIFDKMRKFVYQFREEAYHFDLLNDGKGNFAVCVSKVVDLNKLFFAAKDVKAHGYVNTLVYQTAFDEIESELEKFRCKIYKTKYVPVKSSPISGMIRYFGEDSETKGTDE